MWQLDKSMMRCFQAVFPDLSEQQIRSASTASTAEWDSIAAVSLLSVLEEEFEIRILPDDFTEITSFQRALDFVRREKSS